MADRGTLQISLVSNRGQRPIPGASVDISSTGEPDKIIESLTTDSSGQTEIVDLETPPLEYSMEPGMNQPYSEYNLKISAEGFEPVEIAGSQMLSGQLALQNISMEPSVTETAPYEVLAIGPHTLYGDYPPKIAESEIKDIKTSGEVVLSRVVIPEYVIVHDGAVSDKTANNYYVLYKDYIKNVASCEIYSTWPEETLKANILAIMSFTLNRVYTEWYRNKGFDFTITSSTAFDQKWMNGKNTYESISVVVDDIFDSYLSRPEVTQPILTQYCDGKRVSCPDFMSQWGSKALGDDGLSAIEILRYYYGDDMYINTAESISGIPASYPGYELTIGSSGQKVRQMQEQLNVIAGDYPLIPKIRVDGIYGPATAASVKVFQKIFHLPETGVTDFATWYKISQIYVAVSRIAELM
ncbi:MAG: peptidoglycan-binding protein [Lachnospiraceae bacterium]|nr:peptidoglycan-binding protein [Lachnospiraceae bacterium]MDY5496903.1 peptidoglycan-binding protein [Anaerobutyricum sp.]